MDYNIHRMNNERGKDTMKRKTQKDFPRKIIGHGGYPVTFKELQPLGDGDFAGIYRYRGGEAIHYLEEIKEEDVIER